MYSPSVAVQVLVVSSFQVNSLKRDGRGGVRGERDLGRDIRHQMLPVPLVDIRTGGFKSGQKSIISFQTKQETI